METRRRSAIWDQSGKGPGDSSSLFQRMRQL
jgi:hypothetical protein